MDWFLPLKRITLEEFKKMFPADQEATDEDIKFESFPVLPKQEESVINHYEGEEG